VAARSYLLMDVTANQVLASREIDAPVEPASLTKLMSAYIVFDALRARKISLQQTLPVSQRAWKMPGSRMFIDPKMQVPVEDLIKGMIVQSGNDATMALAEGVGSTSEHFVELMNQQAKALGMKNTSYRNPEGLTAPGHTTTARDLGILASRLIQDFPEYVGYYKLQKIPLPGHPDGQRHQPQPAAVPRPDGGRPQDGHTAAAGYCMVATARRDFPNLPGRRLVAIVLGANSEVARANEAQKLLNWGYTAYEGLRLFDGQPAGAGAAGLEGRRKDRQARPDPADRAGGAGRHGLPDQDPGGAAGPAGGAFHQGPAGRDAQDHGGRPAAARGAAGGAAARGAGRHFRPRLGRHPALDQVTGARPSPAA
jgi:D-alanyl-D-alanine carboxypeptidase (penicillin-binding protein 5/6)